MHGSEFCYLTLWQRDYYTVGTCIMNQFNYPTIRRSDIQLLWPGPQSIIGAVQMSYQYTSFHMCFHCSHRNRTESTFMYVIHLMW